MKNVSGLNCSASLRIAMSFSVRFVSDLIYLEGNKAELLNLSEKPNELVRIEYSSESGVRTALRWRRTCDGWTNSIAPLRRSET